MAGQAPSLYRHDIKSLHSINPTAFPAFFNDSALELDRDIIADTPLNAGDLRHAKGIALSMRGLHESGNMAVTRRMAESAEVRAGAVEAAHILAMYTPVNIAAELRMMNVELQKLIASTTNASIRYRNSKITDLPAAYQPLLKTQPGHGLALALVRCPASVTTPLIAPAVVPNVGDAPLVFPADIDSSVGDPIRLRAKKLSHYLTGLI